MGETIAYVRCSTIQTIGKFRQGYGYWSMVFCFFFHCCILNELDPKSYDIFSAFLSLFGPRCFVSSKLNYIKCNVHTMNLRKCFSLWSGGNTGQFLSSRLEFFISVLRCVDKAETGDWESWREDQVASGEMQIKSTRRPDFPVGWVGNKMDEEVSQGKGEMAAFWWNGACKCCEEWFPKVLRFVCLFACFKLNAELLYDLAIPFLGTYPKEMKTQISRTQRCEHKHKPQCHSTIRKLSKCQGRNENPWHGMWLFGHTNEWKADGGGGGQVDLLITKWKKQGTKGTYKSISIQEREGKGRERRGVKRGGEIPARLYKHLLLSQGT